MLEAPWVQLCAKVDTEPSRGLEFDTFRRVLSEELQGSGGPIELAQAVEELYTRAICHVSGDERGEGEDSGENPTEPSYILECKNYYVEQILRYVSSPTMDEENAKAAIARLSELSVRVRTRLKFVFFELPSVRCDPISLRILSGGTSIHMHVILYNNQQSWLGHACYATLTISQLGTCACRVHQPLLYDRMHPYSCFLSSSP